MEDSRAILEVSTRHPLHHHQKWRKNVSIIVPTKAERPRVGNLGDEVMTIASGTSKFEPLAVGVVVKSAGARFAVTIARVTRGPKFTP